MNDLRYITSDELATFLVENGEKKFRLGQIEDCYGKKVHRILTKCAIFPLI